MKILKSIVILSLSTTLLLAASKEFKDPNMKSVIRTGEKSTHKLLKKLGSNLKKHMKKGGPMDALKYCSDNAFKLTKDIDRSLGNRVSIKRISLKYRNPANAPQADEINVIVSLQALNDANVTLPKHLVQRVDEHTYKFYKPLRIEKKLCLTCHGKLKDIDLKRAIDEVYPIDKARDYKMGDLRGAVVVTVKK